MSRRHRARAQRTRDRPRASSRAPPSRMNPRLERDDRPRERINTRRRHARARRSIETDRVAVSRAVRPRMRARDERRHQSSSIERSIERSSPPASSRRERTHKDKKNKKKNRRRVAPTNDRPMSLVVVVVTHHHHHHHPPRAVFDAHARTDRPARPTDRASDRPRDESSVRRIIRPTDRPPLFFSFFLRASGAPRSRACVRERVKKSNRDRPLDR